MRLRKFVMRNYESIEHLRHRVIDNDGKLRERMHKLEKENRELKEALYPDTSIATANYFNWLFNGYDSKKAEKKRSRIDILEEKLDAVTKMLGVKIEHDKRNIDEYVVKGTPNSTLTITKTIKKKASRKR